MIDLDAIEALIAKLSADSCETDGFAAELLEPAAALVDEGRRLRMAARALWKAHGVCPECEAIRSISPHMSCCSIGAVVDSNAPDKIPCDGCDGSCPTTTSSNS